MIGVFVALVPASRSIGPLDHPWKVSNPIGFIPDSFDESWFWSVWGAGLFILTVTGAASSLIRYRRAGARERQQLKWLLLAFAQFAVIYAIRVLAEGEGVGAVIDVLFFLSVITIPAMIAVAVIWYRLFEIDIIIRKTVLFTLLTGLLVTVYLGSVFLVRSLIGGVVPSGSSLSVVASTLLVAALFAPARSRLQSLIDHRLFRRRYDAAQVTSDFAVDLRRHTDVDTIAAGLARAIGGSVQPASLALWIRATTPLPIPEALPEHVAG